MLLSKYKVTGIHDTNMDLTVLFASGKRLHRFAYILSLYALNCLRISWYIQQESVL